MKLPILISALTLTSWLSDAQTLPELVKQAVANYPLLKAKGYEVQASRDQVAQAKSAALPSLDAAYQLNYATYNNITGMATGQSFVPISGPPSSGNDYNAVFGSVGGLLLNWEPFAFGLTKSKIRTAKAQQEYQQADNELEIFRHQVKTIHTYLDVMMANELIKVYTKNQQRAAYNLRMVQALTQSGLRPDSDSALFRAELSRAKIELMNIEKLKATQEINLSELLGGNGSYVMDSIFFKSLPRIASDTSSLAHPLVKLSASRMQVSMNERTTLQHTLYPKLSFWGTAYARGSGIRYDGYVDAKDGLSFSRYNYGAGLVLSMPLLRFTNVRHQVNAQESIIKAEEEKWNAVKLQLDKQQAVADITLSNALHVAEESPAFYKSAEYSYNALLSRYNSGLVNYADLIQAHYALIKSEADLKLAYMDAWKALLYKAAVRGDINLFMNQLK